MSLVSELKRRKVLQTGAAYVVGSLAAWGAVDLAVEAFGLPSSVLRYAIFASILGLPLALAASWFLEVRLENDEDGVGTRTSRVVLAALGFGGGLGVLAFVILMLGSGADDRPPTAAESPGLGSRGAIAVLPFADMSPGGGNAHFADGIADEILTSLQGWGVFPVISRGSTFGYRGAAIDIPTVAAELGVRYVLLGSVRIAGGAVRVTGQLIDAESDTQIWADRFDGDLHDIFAVQDQITEDIVTAIAPEITRSEMRRAARSRPTDLAAWELVLRAQASIAGATYQDAMEAKELLELALEREPGYALAYARLAEIGHDASNNLSRDFGNDAAVRALRDALDQARQAVQLDPSLVDARIWYGHLLLHDKQVPAGLVELREAVRLNPSHAQAHAELGFGLALEGQVEPANREFDVATRLSPNDPRNDRIVTFQALANLYSGDNGGAAIMARRAVSAQPGSPAVLVAAIVEISALSRDGRLPEARERVSEFRSRYGELDWPAFARGAWTEAELDRVRRDLQVLGMVD